MGDGDGLLWELLGRYLEAEGVELDDLAVRGSGAGRVLRVTVDAAGGVSVDRIAGLAPGLSGSHRGVLTEVTEGQVAVLVDGTDRHIPLSDVAQARTIFRWEKAAKPGKRAVR